MSPWIVVAGSALFAGIVALTVTLMMEKWGGLVGGVLGTLPTTIVPAAIGVHANLPSPQSYGDSMFIVPAGMFLNAGFLFLWRELPRRLPAWSLSKRLAAMTVLSLSAWLFGAVFLVHGIDWFRNSGCPMMAFGVGTTLLLTIAGVLACLSPLPSPKGNRRVGLFVLLARGLVAAASIGVSVWIASLGGALSAGIAAVFPAIFLTTMVGLWLSQGEAVPAGAVGPMMLGSTSVAVYALVASQALPLFGAVVGTIFAWVAAASLVTVPATVWLSRRRRLQASA